MSFDYQGRIVQSNSGSNKKPSVAVGAGAGTGASATNTGTSKAGKVNLTTGTSAATGLLFTVTYPVPYKAAPIVNLQAADADSAGKALHVMSYYNKFEVRVAGSALGDSTVFEMTYSVKEA